MTRPRSADDLDALYLRARLRLERRRRPRTAAEAVALNAAQDVVMATPIEDHAAFAAAVSARNALYVRETLVREAAALVAAIDALREDEPVPLDVPPHYDGHDGSLEITQEEEDAMIAGEDENMRRWSHGDR